MPPDAHSQRSGLTANLSGPEETTMRRLIGMLSVLLLASLLLSACGGGDPEPACEISPQPPREGQSSRPGDPPRCAST